MTKEQKEKLIDIFKRIQNQLLFFGNTPEDSEALKEGVNDICMETIDSIKKQRI